MKTIWTLCKIVKWMHVWTKHQRGLNMKTKKIKIKKISEEDAEKQLFKTLRKMGLV